MFRCLETSHLPSLGIQTHITRTQIRVPPQIHVGKVPREKGQVAVRNLGEHQFKLATVGSVEHSQFVRLVLWAMDGPPVIELIDGHGRIRYLALVRKRVQLRPRSDGCTIYVDWAVPDKEHICTGDPLALCVLRCGRRGHCRSSAGRE